MKMNNEQFRLSQIFEQAITRKCKHYRKKDLTVENELFGMWHADISGRIWNDERQNQHRHAVSKLFDAVRPYKNDISVFLVYGSLVSNSVSEQSIHVCKDTNRFTIEESDVDGLILTKYPVSIPYPFCSGKGEVYDVNGIHLENRTFNILDGVKTMTKMQYFDEIAKRQDVGLMYYSSIKYNSVMLNDSIDILGRLRSHFSEYKEPELDEMAKRVFHERISDLKHMMISLAQNGR